LRHPQAEKFILKITCHFFGISQTKDSFLGGLRFSYCSPTASLEHGTHSLWFYEINIFVLKGLAHFDFVGTAAA
jgi:hypothetical protein